MRDNPSSTACGGSPKLRARFPKRVGLQLQLRGQVDRQVDAFQRGNAGPGERMHYPRAAYQIRPTYLEPRGALQERPTCPQIAPASATISSFPSPFILVSDLLRHGNGSISWVPFHEIDRTLCLLVSC